MSEIVYAVHTRACTYLLDDEGFCRWVLSRSGAKSDDRCVGAQFVAALDLHSKGGLIGELRIGASALFIRSENGRFVLIRTKPIEHVEIRGGEGSETEPEEQQEEPVVLPDRFAVAAVFDAPVPAREPEPPSARVILQTHGHPRTEPPPPPPPVHDIASPRTEPLPRSAPPLPAPAPAPVRSFPKPPPRYPEPPPRASEPPRPAFPEPPPRAQSVSMGPQAAPNPGAPRAPTQVMRSFPEPPPRVSEPPRASFPEPPPRVSSEPPRPFPEPRGSSRRGARDASSETQPLPPSGPVPAWPPMLAPPPPQAELLPLGPARPHLPSAEELDVNDLEEVMEDDQIYSMEVTLTMPLFKGDPSAAHHFRR